jgi:DNA-binding response OmpR family regulator
MYTASRGQALNSYFLFLNPDPMKKTKLLLVEDDISLGFIIKDNLELKGFEVDLFPDGEKGWIAFQSNPYDLCILDIMLPKKDGFALIESIRRQNQQVPVLFLTARSAQKDRIEGFRKGADDYITKPFGIEELIMRVEVFLKRSQVAIPPGDVVKIGAYTFDIRNMNLMIQEKTCTLTRKEADLLELFCRHKEQLIKREDILKSIWGNDDYFLGRSLDVFVSRLRKYLKEDENIEIVNQFGIGFRLQEKKANTR